MLINHIYHADNNDFALILEDDIEPLSFEFSDVIKQGLRTYPDSWDIIKLHHDGFSYKNSIYFGKFINGSAAAYLISRNGMKKISQYKVSYHIDWQYWWLYWTGKINMYKWRHPLFSISSHDSNIGHKNVHS